MLALAAVTVIRPLVYGGAARRSSCLPVSANTDPAIAQALAARTRREYSRDLAARDPVLAKELRRARKYDDGGLVDVNSAPAG